MPEKHLLILGGAGKSGILVVRDALGRGHKVTAYSRDTARVKEECSVAVENQSLNLIECDLRALRDELIPILSNVDAIISILGPNSLGYTGTDIAELYQWMLIEMRKLPSERRPYFLITSTQSIVDPKDGFDLFTKIHIFFIMTIAPGARKETLAIKDVFMEELTFQRTDIDWTVCRLNLLKDTGLPANGAKAGYVAKDGWLSTMDRSQLAYWLIGEAELEPLQRKWVRKMPALWGDAKI